MTAPQTTFGVSTFTLATREAFHHYLAKHPNKSRVSTTDEKELIEWLLDRSKQPASQAEFSRRNYVQSAFSWDESTHRLFAKSKLREAGQRLVVTEDMIIDAVEYVHVEESQHGGWDATWKALSAAYYGIPRSDLIFLLKRCEVCSKNPRNKPKATPRRREQRNHQLSMLASDLVTGTEYQPAGEFGLFDDFLEPILHSSDDLHSLQSDATSGFST